MKIIANNINERLIIQPKFLLDEMDLSSSTKNAKNYMSAHICGTYYPAINIPSNERLIKDLKEMLSIYSDLINMLYNKSIEETLEFYLKLEEIKDTQFQTDILISKLNKTPKEPISIPLQINQNKKAFWKRNPCISKEVLQNAKFLCEVDNSHFTFTSDITNKNFVEDHHLIPMKLQHKFKWSLDVPVNIISLCPNCHRKIHHSTKHEKRKLINTLFKIKNKELKIYGLEITLHDLFTSY